uniref:Fungal lipase-like domain-containing protein n=1 Tax=Acrobeloides nanus TaxID=290746 RepID=A0A914CMM2_9BILA
MSIQIGRSLSLFYIIFVFYAWAQCSLHTDCTSCTQDDGVLGIGSCCWNPSTSTCQATLLSGLCASGSTGVTYNCPTNPPSDFTYTDKFGRNYTLPFIASAYGDFNQAQVCLSNTVPDAQLIAVYNDSNNCSSVLALLPSQNTIVVAFRGTQGTTQFVITELNLILQGPLVPFPPGGNVFSYFSSCFLGIWNAGLGANLQSLKQANPDYGLWVFGHSLGAALASLTSTYAVYKNISNSNDVKLITTGQPRTGDLNYAIAHDSFIPHSYRLVNVADLVTKLPVKVNLDATNAFHHHFEIWYNQNMLIGANFKVCKQAEDSTCSSSTSLIQSLSYDYHNTYFNTSINTWFENGCI